MQEELLRDVVAVKKSWTCPECHRVVEPGHSEVHRYPSLVEFILFGLSGCCSERCATVKYVRLIAAIDAAALLPFLGVVDDGGIVLRLQEELERLQNTHAAGDPLTH